MAELRSVLRFIYLEVVTRLQLGTAVPPVGGWRLATLPPTMTAADVQQLLDSCDRSTEVGIRDFAMMTLVARLGLRSIEVARLELVDVDWWAGELVVRGKGRREERLPLPAEVGEALVAHLSAGRNPGGARHVFLTCRAPRGPIRADLVGDVVERACCRAGVTHVGAAPASACLGWRAAAPGRWPGRDQPGPSASGSGHHRPLCQGRPGGAAPGRAALAGNTPMSALEQSLADCLALRRSLGHELAEAAWLLPGFVTYLDAHAMTTVTVQAALAWAQHSPTGQGRTVGPRRMTAARGFARYLSGIDPSTEVPPLGVMPYRQRWRLPFIYSPAQIDQLIAKRDA